MDNSNDKTTALHSKILREHQTSKKRRRIMCVGMCVLDLVHVCAEFPKEDTDKRCIAGFLQRGGNASNNCTVLRLLGCDCEFLGMLSDSPAFGVLLEDCRNRGIDISNCPRTIRDPPFSSVILVRDTRTIIHSNADFPILKHEHFQKVNLANLTWIHFEARNTDDTLKMIRDIHEWNIKSSQHITISVEFEKLCEQNLVLGNWADYVFLSKDFAIYLGWSNPRDAVFSLREKLTLVTEKNYNKCAIICPWGSHGVSVLDAVDKYSHIPASKPKKIIDTLGAGDTFVAATIYALHHLELSINDAASFGNNCAGYKLGHRGYDAISEFNFAKSTPTTDAEKETQNQVLHIDN